MKEMSRLFVALALWFCVMVCGESRATASPERWRLTDDGGIRWELKDTDALPHDDHIAMSGQSVDMILEWKIDEQGAFSAKRLIRWPMLRTIPDDTHASLQRRLGDENGPPVMLNNDPIRSGKTVAVKIHGSLTVHSKHAYGVSLTHTIFPCVHAPAIVDLYRLTNTSEKAIRVDVPRWRQRSETPAEKGVFGTYTIEEFLIGEGIYRVAPNDHVTYGVVRSARKGNDAPYFGNPEAELAARRAFIEDVENRLVLETPDPVLNRLFAFSKLRAVESIFSTRGGLMHGPGGYNKYLAAIWANDQAEYVNPFFPFLGHPAGNESALNSFRHFAKKMNPEYKPIPSSIIAEGRDIWNGAGDRGDAAMIAYGAARFCLASGNLEWSEELWPLIEWCLEYCLRHKTSEGVIASRTDELEGRFPAGKANLCTSCLYYDALISSAYLSDDLDKPNELTHRYEKEAEALRRAIKDYFEADVEGFATYQYYEGNSVLRSWICVPLTVGIEDRVGGTVEALFSPRLWTEDGLLTKAGTKTVWDRSTLYALRGVLASEESQRGLGKLRAFSRQRLLGDHVPYVIEAYPEQNQSHLSAESGLYCRIFTEGLFGIRPLERHGFYCTPRLPVGWERMALRRVHAFGAAWDIEVSRTKGKINVRVTDSAGAVLYEGSGPEDKWHYVNLY